MNKILLKIIILICIICPNALGYEQFASVEQNIYGYEFKQNDALEFLKKGNYYIKLFEKETNDSQKAIYLQEAMRYYFLLSKADNSRIESYIGLGKVYDEMNLDRYAKQNFSIAYNINNKNPELNYRFGDFYFKRKQLQKAQFYYNRAYNLGLSNNQDLRTKMSLMYNMLADEAAAKKYAPTTNSNISTNYKYQRQYNNANNRFSKNSVATEQAKSNQQKTQKASTPSQPTKVMTPEYKKELEHAKKILLIDDTKSNFSQYYLFIK